MPEIVNGGRITAADLMSGLQEAARSTGEWKSLPAEEAILHARGRVFPDSLLKELEWHIREVQHVNTKRHFVLAWPILGRLLRDQHEINRLILISLEKSVDLINTIEGEFGRIFAGFRDEERALWIKRFRFLGSRLGASRNGIRKLRDMWEGGRCTRHRLRSRHQQQPMNICIEDALRAMGEVSSTLVEIAEKDHLRENPLAELPESSGIQGNSMVNHVESCLWHAAEGRAVREKQQTRWSFVQWVQDPQKQLNRIYMIALEENFTILQELANRVCHLDYMTNRNDPQKA